MAINENQGTIGKKRQRNDFLRKLLTLNSFDSTSIQSDYIAYNKFTVNSIIHITIGLLHYQFAVSTARRSFEHALLPISKLLLPPDLVLLETESRSPLFMIAERRHSNASCFRSIATLSGDCFNNLRCDRFISSSIVGLLPVPVT